MSVKIISAAEMRSTAYEGAEYIGNDLSVQTSTVHSGEAAYSTPASPTSGAKYSARWKLSYDTSGGIYAAAMFYIVTAPSDEVGIMDLGNNDFAMRYYVTLDNSRTLRLYDQAGQVTGTTTAPNATWFCLEMRVDLSGGAGACICEARMDEGSVFASETSGTYTYAINRFITGINLLSGTFTSGQIYIDCIQVNDEAGSYQNSWPGICYFDVLRPNADEGTPQGSPSDAVSDFYEMVDEDPSPDDSTTYWELETDDDVAEAQLVSRSTTGIDLSDTINFIAVYTRQRAETAALTKWYTRIRGQSGGTVDESSTYTQMDDDAWWSYSDSSGTGGPLECFYTNPQDSAAWEPSDLDNVCIGVKCTDATPDMWLTKIAAYISYTPSSGQTVTPSVASASCTAHSPTANPDTATVLPGVSIASASAHAPTVDPGTATVSPSISSATAAAHSPTVQQGALNVAPDIASATGGAFSPSASGSSAATMSPDVSSATASAYSPSISIGTITVTPDIASATSAAHAPSTSATGSATIYPSISSAECIAFSPVAAGAGAVTVSPTVSSVSASAYSPLAQQGTFIEGITDKWTIPGYGNNWLIPDGGSKWDIPAGGDEWNIPDV